MLITCPECELQVSDKALSCPHCGYPITGTKRRPTTKKRMRLPNGFGQITEIKSKKLRKPFRAMVTVGKDEFGKPICKLLKPEAYFETYNDAYNALMEYNKNPYDINDAMTVKELYDEWSGEYFKNIQASSIRTITSAWAYCGSVENIMARQVRSRHIKACMDTCDSPNTRNRIKSMFNLMLDYAVEHEIVDTNHARDFKVARVEATNGHKAFKAEEIEMLWADNSRLANIILLQCYTGWRPQELCNVLLEDVDLCNFTMMGGMKTDAGKNRIVPVPEIAKGLLTRLYEIAENFGSEYLICREDGTHMTYDMYYKEFTTYMKDHNISHNPHDCRKQFITLCKRYDVDEYAIKRMAGHKINDITEKIYTERDPDWLAKEVNKVKKI